MKIKQLANQDIRKLIKESGLRHFEIFNVMHISEASFTRMLRVPLSAEDKEIILEAVKNLSEGRC